MKKKILILVAVLMVLGSSDLFANAQSTGMPWETTLEKIQKSISGPVVRILGIIILAAGGIGLAMGGGQGVKQFAWAAVGIGIALNVANLMSSLFGVSGALI